MLPLEGLSFANVVKRTSKSVFGAKDSTQHLSILDAPLRDPETDRPLPRTFLPNALEFNFSGHGDHPDKFLKALHAKYGDRVHSVRRMSNSKFQLGFASREERTKAERDPLIYDEVSIPITMTFCQNAHVLCITATNLAVTTKDETAKALKSHFSKYGTIADIRLHFAGQTGWLLPSAAIYIDITADPSVVEKIDRCPIILGQQATLHWRNSPPLCVYCKTTGHAVASCGALQRKKAKAKLLGLPTPTHNAKGRKRVRQDSPSLERQSAMKDAISDKATPPTQATTSEDSTMSTESTAPATSIPSTTPQANNEPEMADCTPSTVNEPSTSGFAQTAPAPSNSDQTLSAPSSGGPLKLFAEKKTAKPRKKKSPTPMPADSISKHTRSAEAILMAGLAKMLQDEESSMQTEEDEELVAMLDGGDYGYD